MSKKHILIIDDSVTNLKFIERALESLYSISLLISGAQALKFLLKHKPDLILIDTNMPDMDGFETLKAIRNMPQMQNTPIILLSSYEESEKEALGIELGASDFIRRPLALEVMISRIKMHLEFSEYKHDLEDKVRKKTEMIEHLYDMMMLSLAELVECRDENTGGHVKRTAEYVRILTESIIEAGLYKDVLTPGDVKDIIRSAPLHDIGKIGISDATLLKTTSLDEEEFEHMKQHSELGGRTLQKMINETNYESFLYTAKDMALYHHEKWDGSGYPEGLKGEEIPISARIMAIVDVYDALTTKRPYKEPISHEVAVKIILDGKGKGFDPNIIDIFEEMNYKFQLVNF